MTKVMYKSHKTLAGLFDQFTKDYKSGELEGMNNNQIAKRYEIHGQTVNRWIIRIETEKKNRKQPKQLIQELPADWQWIKISVGPSLKTKFDKLTKEQKILLYKLFDAEIKLLDQQAKKVDDHIQYHHELTSKTIAIKVSPEAIAIWSNLPVIREKNQFSKASWAISKVVDPFLNLMIQ